jgi:hypothetical protein
MSASSKSPDRLKRRSRMVRQKNPPPVQMTAERLLLLEALLRFPVLNRDQLQRLGGYASRNTVNYALGLLFHAGYIDRRFAPPIVAGAGQDYQALYLLDRKGCAVLAARRGLSDWRELGWNPKGNTISWWHLHHLVASNALIIAFEEAARAAACQLTWLAERELRQPERLARVEIQLPDGRRRRTTAVADAFLLLTPAVGKPLACFLECDRGTVDVSQRWPTKILAYEAFLQSPAYPKCFPLGPHTVAVLTVTTSDQRALHLKVASEKVSQAGFFLFTTFTDATNKCPLTDPIWHIVHHPDRYALLGGASSRPTSIHLRS